MLQSKIRATLLLFGVWFHMVFATPSIVMTMICRDEAVNLKTNLAKWLSIVDSYVFVIDKRTTDDSVATIERILNHAHKSFRIIYNDFEGFGSSRTLSLTEAWNNFPYASHVLIADPDWVPDIETMNIKDLHENAEVFRFTVFDRNGNTKRRMDWLLRHRQGLAMRYNLHEVLDIGTYNSVQYLDWVLHEVERPGTWHTTVGHGNSMSSKRLQFDLEMLHKDLLAYGHDPHTHYYLGITNQAIAQAAQQQGLSMTDPDTQRYLQEAIYYLQLRVDSQYRDEFVEERWACMYMLGIVYANLQRDLIKSEFWLSMCRDYSAGQSECSIALAKIFLANGAFDQALRETERVLQTANEERDMLSHFRNYLCELPELVLALFQHKAYMGQLSTGEVKYMLLMLQMRKQPVCEGMDQMQLVEEVKQAMKRMLKEEGGQSMRAGEEHVVVFVALELIVSAVTFDTPSSRLCADGGLQQFLANSRFLLHPCDEFRAQQAVSTTCQIFTYNLPPANEEMQATSAAKEFVGAAQLLDVIHRVHGGDSRAVFRSDRPYRILLAEHFNAKALFNLVGFFDRVDFSNYRIHVVTSDAARIAAMEAMFVTCGGRLKVAGAVLPLTYEQVDLMTYLRVAASKLRQLSPESSSLPFRFDYIEYSGGMSVEETHPEQLALMRQVLSPEGVLGLTYFARNHHVDKLRRFRETKNTSALPPFSLETARLVRSYLDLHKMSFLKEDAALVTFLGGEPVPRTHPPRFLSEVAPSVEWRAFSQDEVETAARLADLRPVAWIPSAYAHPFDELNHYEIKKFWAAGMTQQHFVENYMTFFRYSIYLQRVDASSPGRAVLAAETLADSTLADSVQVLDRIGSLGGSFGEIWRRAEQSLSTSFAFAPYSIRGEFSLDYQALPQVTPCLAHLSSGASLWQLHRVNVEFAEKHNRAVDEVSLRGLLLHLLNYLESINVITYLSKVGPIAAPNRSSVAALEKRSGTTSRHSDTDQSTVKQIGGLKMRFVDKETPVAATKTTESTPIKIGGLNIRFKDKTGGSATSQSATNAAQRETSSSNAPVEPTARKGSLNVRSSVTKDVPPIRTEQQELPAARTQQTESGSRTLPLDTQIARMRALGLSEDLIAETLRSARQGHAAPHNAAHLLADQSGSLESVGAIKTKLRDVLQILTTEALDGSGPVVTATMDSRGLPETYEPTMAGGLLLQQQKKKATQELKPMSDSQNKLGVSGNVGTVASTAERNALLGLKQRLLGADRLSDKAASESHSEKTSLIYGNGPVSAKRVEPSISSAEVAGVKLPAAQTAQMLQSSFRRTECFYLSHERGPLPANCVQPTPVKRRTAALNAMSLAKMEFDAAQLRHIAAAGLLNNRAMTNSLLTEYGRVGEYFKARQWTDRYKVARLTNADMQVAKSIPALNRAVFLSEEDADLEALTHRGAISYLQDIASTADADRSDFMVVDVLLKEEALSRVGAALLASTVWFDVTNGICFVAHSDDGLVLPSVGVLAQQIGFALSSPGKKMRVVRFYAVAMSLNRMGGASPVAMGKTHETVVVLWLSPHKEAVEVEEQSSAVQEDGLRIFDEYAASKLFAQGVSEYPNVHSEFLSKSGDLAIAMPPRSNQTTSELVARRANRLVIVKGKRPFTFSVPSVGDRDEWDRNDSFAETTMLAVVIVLSSR